MHFQKRLVELLWHFCVHLLDLIVFGVVSLSFDHFFHVLRQHILDVLTHVMPIEAVSVADTKEMQTQLA